MRAIQLVLSVIMWGQLASAQSVRPPLLVSDIVEMLALQMPPERVLDRARTNCVGFIFDRRAERELIQGGVTGALLLELRQLCNPDLDTLSDLALGARGRNAQGAGDNERAAAYYRLASSRATIAWVRNHYLVNAANSWLFRQDYEGVMAEIGVFVRRLVREGFDDFVQTDFRKDDLCYFAVVGGMALQTAGTKDEAIRAWEAGRSNKYGICDKVTREDLNRYITTVRAGGTIR